jgi:hypothetical protein
VCFVAGVQIIHQPPIIKEKMDATVIFTRKLELKKCNVLAVVAITSSSTNGSI